jgi:secondary thiamine-phosphate synthase enzyme
LRHISVDLDEQNGSRLLVLLDGAKDRQALATCPAWMPGRSTRISTSFRTLPSGLMKAFRKNCGSRYRATWVREYHARGGSVLRESNVREGLVLVNAMHITASGVHQRRRIGPASRLREVAGSLAPHEPTSQYHHNRTGEDNADAHLKRQIMGREVVVAITAGKLDFGPWEQIFYGEFDGRRRKRVLVKIIGE